MPLGFAAPRFIKGIRRLQPLQGGEKNVLIIVFDALSASNISLYGYQRGTMPNLDRLAERAIVYHSHFAGGNFTTSGTASLLTGTLPWTHRALQPNGVVAEPFVTRSFFHAFQNYYRVAYTHNPWAFTLLRQFRSEIDELVPREKLFLGSQDDFFGTLFKNDEDIASVSWVRIMQRAEEGYAYSLFLSGLYEQLRNNQLQKLRPLFPRGFPRISGDYYFTLEQAVDWIQNRLGDIAQPFFGYFHFLPPHYPYRTRRDFYGRFKEDGFVPPDKPTDMFSLDKPSDPLTANAAGASLLADRTSYDEFILYVDSEFGRFFKALESSGLLENTWVVLTADHGEMFERGIEGHITAVLYQPVIHVPLLIFEPGRKDRLDVHTPTSAVDVLPTLLQVTGQKAADWAEGTLLPPFGPTGPGFDRSIYALQARNTEKDAPIKEATAVLVRGQYKLAYYFGYKRLENIGERVELYDLGQDPEELVDLFPSRKDIALDLLDGLKSKLAEVNKPYP